jgi:methylated-DNA-[protein]-cysteine S-methyltransferase
VIGHQADAGADGKTLHALQNFHPRFQNKPLEPLPHHRRPLSGVFHSLRSVPRRESRAGYSQFMTSDPFLIRIPSPLGRLELTSDGEAILSLTIEGDESLPCDTQAENSTPVLNEAARQLDEYFAGSRTSFDLPVRLTDGTAFQQAIWKSLATIGFGEVLSYGELGARAGRPGSGRAVGGAVGANPVPIIIGCHRVLATNGRITGYSGGKGIPTKVWLLDHEGIGHRE